MHLVSRVCCVCDFPDPACLEAQYHCFKILFPGSAICFVLDCAVATCKIPLSCCSFRLAGLPTGHTPHCRGLGFGIWNLGSDSRCPLAVCVCPSGVVVNQSSGSPNFFSIFCSQNLTNSIHLVKSQTMMSSCAVIITSYWN